MKHPGILLLEDGSVFRGSIFGSVTRAYGEVVFTTSMTGYEHSITDPSYRGQILVFSYPLIGNYRFRAEELQSSVPQVRGIVLAEYTAEYSGSELDSFLSAHGIPGISGVDTRSLVRHVRQHGTMKGFILPGESLDGSELSELKGMPDVWKSNLVAEVSTQTPLRPVGKGRRIALLDFGVKRNLIRDLSTAFEVHVLPYSCSMDEIESLRPGGIVLSSGPGDPAHPSMRERLPFIRELCSNYPVLGVCLGHQLVALAYGASAYKLKFGHRGINHPVRFAERVYTTSQNHGFAVSGDFDSEELSANQWSLNDGTVEGFSGEHGNVITCQYHPEGGPGPSDTSFIYEYFRKIVGRE